MLVRPGYIICPLTCLTLCTFSLGLDLVSLSVLANTLQADTFIITISTESPQDVLNNNTISILAKSRTLSTILCHDNGMGMSMDGAMSLTSGKMLMWFHFTPGDNLWFQGWVPKSAGAMAGTCIGLFLLAVVDRGISACRGVMEMHWARR